MTKAATNRTPLAWARPRARSEDPIQPMILEFQWPSAAIVNAPVPRSARGVIWMVATMVAALVAIMALIPIDRVVTARGLVVSEARTILVQPLETSIVRSIDVREGQESKPGSSWRDSTRLSSMRI